MDNFIVFRQFWEQDSRRKNPFKLQSLEGTRKKLIVIAGPTAVGKTAVAVRLAKFFKTEVISADSRQIFRELTIGTAKPAEGELQEVRHHFINSHTIRENFDAARYGKEALEVIKSIFQKHTYAILCGGSGLYIKAVLEGFDDIPEVPASIRKGLMNQFDAHGLVWLQEKLKELDPHALEKLDLQNPHRMIRALEVKIGTGQSIFTYRKNERINHDFQVIKIGLELQREELYRRIDERMDSMINQGLFFEAEQVYPFKDHNALQTVGYQEIFDFMDGLYNRDEAIRLLKRNSRRYAKRQLTWFRRDPEMKWFVPDQLERVIEYIRTYPEIKQGRMH